MTDSEIPETPKLEDPFNQPLRIEIHVGTIFNSETMESRRGGVMDLYGLDWGPTGRLKATKIAKNILAIKGIDKPSRADMLRWVADQVEQADAR